MTEPLTAPAYLSPSSMGTFKQCPLRFKYSRIDGLTEPPTSATMLGNFVHDVLEQFYHLESNLRTQQSAREIARHYWDEKWESNVATLNLSSAQVREFRWSAWWCIDNLWKLEDPFTVDPTGIEHELVGEVGGVQIKGFVDRYSVSESGLVISDYKTGKKPNPRYASDKFFQLLVYAAALESFGFGTTSEVELLFLKESSRLRMSVTPSLISETVANIQKIKAAVDERCRSGNFEPIKSKLCDWCNFKSICPAWKGTK